MRVDHEPWGVRVSDGDGVVCRIDAEGGNWSDHTGTPEIDAPVAETLSGRAARLRFPPGRIKSLTGSDERSGVGRPETARGIRGPIRIETGITVAVAFAGTATVEYRPDGIDVTFADARPVTLGLHPPRTGPDRTITVPGTPEGVATALTHASAAHATTAPARSLPATRRNPPPIERGDAVAVPEGVRSTRTDTGIELRVPPDLGSLFVLAPLAYYLGARVSVASRQTPLLRAPDVGVRHELSSLPELQADAASLLYRTITLDCLLRDARNEGERSSDRRASERLLDAAGIDSGETAETDLDARLAAYLDAAFREIESDLPEWHLSVYAPPTPEHVASLPYVLDRLAFVYLPDATRLPEAERIQRSLEDFYRSPGDAPTVEPILPDLNRGRLHAWLADGVAIDTFRLLPEAHANRRSRPPIGGDQIDVTLVISDPEMQPEVSAIRRLYRKGSNACEIDLRVERRLGRDALASVFRRRTDLLHYVGHCDRAGLRCPDGHLDAADLDRCGARVFFLNACGSYHQGVSLVEAGSVAGAVTLRPVLDGQAKRVGTAFARLLTRGFAVERALRIASRRAIMNKDYAVVGDGAYALGGPDDADRVVAHVSRLEDGFRVRIEHGPPRAPATYRPSLLGEEECLQGSERRASMSRDELCAFLRGLEAPTVYEGRYYWARDLRRVLRDGEAGK